MSSGPKKVLISLRGLFQQGGSGSGFRGHKGRPGKQGGSLPEGSGDVKLPSDRNYKARDTSIEDAMRGFGDDTGGSIRRSFGGAKKSGIQSVSDVFLREQLQMANSGRKAKWEAKEIRDEMKRRRSVRKKKTHGVPGLYRDIFKD
jgi:hypothetical protein